MQLVFLNHSDELKQRLRTFAQGDLEAPFPAVDSQDEIADMVGLRKHGSRP